jgi:hypothetical protein
MSRVDSSAISGDLFDTAGIVDINGCVTMGIFVLLHVVLRLAVLQRIYNFSPTLK